MFTRFKNNISDSFNTKDTPHIIKFDIINFKEWVFAKIFILDNPFFDFGIEYFSSEYRAVRKDKNKDKKKNFLKELFGLEKFYYMRFIRGEKFGFF
jgi:hypothetical protein